MLLSLSADSLQKQLNRLHEYCKNWDLEINTGKSKSMILSKNVYAIPSYCLNVGGSKLEWVKHYKYLGVEFHCNGNMFKQSRNLCSRGWKALFKVNSATKNVYIKTSTRLSLFDKLVRPVL